MTSAASTTSVAVPLFHGADLTTDWKQPAVFPNEPSSAPEDSFASAVSEVTASGSLDKGIVGEDVSSSGATKARASRDVASLPQGRAQLRQQQVPCA